MHLWLYIIFAKWACQHHLLLLSSCSRFHDQQLVAWYHHDLRQRNKFDKPDLNPSTVLPMVQCKRYLLHDLKSTTKLKNTILFLQIGRNNYLSSSDRRILQTRHNVCEQRTEPLQYFRIAL